MSMHDQRKQPTDERRYLRAIQPESGSNLQQQPNINGTRDISPKSVQKTSSKDVENATVQHAFIKNSDPADSVLKQKFLDQVKTLKKLKESQQAPLIEDESERLAVTPRTESLENQIPNISKENQRETQTPSKGAITKHFVYNIQSLRMYFPEWNEIMHKLFRFNYSNIICSYKRLRPLDTEDGIQGSGLSALAMATQIVRKEYDLKSIEDFHKLTQKEGFTIEGHVSTASDIATLATKILKCPTKIYRPLNMDKWDILIHLCRGLPVLIACDDGTDGVPEILNGQDVRWAVLHGVCFCMPHNQYRWPEEHTDGTILKNFFHSIFFFMLCSARIYVFAHQGNGKGLDLWDFELLKFGYQNSENDKSGKTVAPAANSMWQSRKKVVLLGYHKNISNPFISYFKLE